MASDAAHADDASIARVYGLALGGSRGNSADRETLDDFLRDYPLFGAIARVNRMFLRRLVRHLALLGIDQFLDLGSGVPSDDPGDNVHEIARAVDPAARVVYVERDPVAAGAWRQVLEGDERAAVIEGDIAEPGSVWHDPRTTGLLDPGRPVAVLMSAVLHFFDDEAAARLVRGYLRPLAPGSYLGLSQAGGDDAAARPALSTYGARVHHVHLRGRAEVTAFFDGLELVEPGVVLRPEWHPEPGVALDADSRAVLRARAGYCGLGRKPEA
ncbi:SAM-dependent methyltransferase [Streptomyces sp. NPDC047002]|uniref:SAM-dependent methyltransferase n=1 Tax=Streptomyces sp. NPDC047002 TaxID=3155475 RepID=UPI003455654F